MLILQSRYSRVQGTDDICEQCVVSFSLHEWLLQTPRSRPRCIPRAISRVPEQLACRQFRKIMQICNNVVEIVVVCMISVWKPYSESIASIPV